MTRRKLPTMADVARLAGVSSMTVSRALRPDGAVSEETRRRIEQVAAELGYIHDSTASGFASGRSGFVAMTIPSINAPNFADTVRGVTDVLHGSGFDLLLGYTDYQKEEEERLIRAFLRRRPEAMVVTGGVHSAGARQVLKSSGVPVFEIWDLPEDPIGHVVGFSNQEAGRIIARHLYDQGYRRLGFVGGETTRDTRGADRRRGFFKELVTLGVATDRLVAAGAPPINMHQGAECMEILLERWPDTEAVMCVSDAPAFGAMTAALRRGLAIPDDIAIAGFGDYDIANCAIPRITTVNVGAHDIGRRTGELILEVQQAADSALKPIIERMPIRLVERESTQPVVSDSSRRPMAALAKPKKVV